MYQFVMYNLLIENITYLCNIYIYIYAMYTPRVYIVLYTLILSSFY